LADHRKIYQGGRNYLKNSEQYYKNIFLMMF
jgi:hypothetical protein